jgi:hypothetical protein
VELERMRAENERLRVQLSAAETLATEREQRIEDLVAALQGLPQAWMRYLERTAEPESPDDAPQSGGRDPATVIEVLGARPQEASSPARPAHPLSSPAPVPPDLAAAEAAWREVRVLRDRLERERLDKELERLRTRKRGRFRRQGLRRAS